MREAERRRPRARFAFRPASRCRGGRQKQRMKIDRFYGFGLKPSRSSVRTALSQGLCDARWNACIKALRMLALALCFVSCHEGRPSFRSCQLAWSLNGEMVCEDDLYELSEDFRQARVAPRLVRPGTRYQQWGTWLGEVGVMDSRWLRSFEIPVWIHGDVSRRLRALPGMGSRRLSALRACPARSCCDPSRVPGIGPKTIAKWGARAQPSLAGIPCLYWDGQGMSLVPCSGL